MGPPIARTFSSSVPFHKKMIWIESQRLVCTMRAPAHRSRFADRWHWAQEEIRRVSGLLSFCTGQCEAETWRAIAKCFSPYCMLLEESMLPSGDGPKIPDIVTRPDQNGHVCNHNHGMYCTQRAGCIQQAHACATECVRALAPACSLTHRDAETVWHGRSEPARSKHMPAQRECSGGPRPLRWASDHLCKAARCYLAVCFEFVSL